MKMRNIFLGFLYFGIIILGCDHKNEVTYKIHDIGGNSIEIDSMEYVVYSVLLDEIVEYLRNETECEEDHHKSFLIWNKTQAGTKIGKSFSLVFSSNVFKTLQDETYENFVYKNHKSYFISKTSLNLKYNYSLVKEEEILALRSNSLDYFNKLREKYSDFCALIRLSRIGFNRNKTQALAYVDYMNYKTNGAGFIILLIKSRGKWIIKERVKNWIS